MYCRSWKISLEEGRQRQRRLGGGYSRAEDLIAPARQISIASELIDMLPSQNMRMVREIFGVLYSFCSQHHPWEIGIRRPRKGDPTRDNVTPVFAQILVTGTFSLGEREALL